MSEQSNGQRVAIVTGGARGIGAAITTALARTGIHVAAGYSRNAEAAEELAGKLGAEGASISVHQGDVGEPGDCTRVVNEVLEAQGRVDYLVNNAGITQDKTMRKMTVENWHAVLRINLSGAFYMTKAVAIARAVRGWLQVGAFLPRSGRDVRESASSEDPPARSNAGKVQRDTQEPGRDQHGRGEHSQREPGEFENQSNKEQHCGDDGEHDATSSWLEHKYPPPAPILCLRCRIRGLFETTI